MDSFTSTTESKSLVKGVLAGRKPFFYNVLVRGTKKKVGLDNKKKQSNIFNYGSSFAWYPSLFKAGQF